MRRLHYLILAGLIFLLIFTGCNRDPKVDTALLEQTPVTVSCYSDNYYYHSSDEEETKVFDDYTFTGYPENVEITDTSETGKVTATAIIANDYYFTSEPVKITFSYVIEKGEIRIYSAAAEENAAAICPTQEFSIDVLFEQETPLVLEYNGTEIPVTKEYIASIEIVTNDPYPCIYPTNMESIYYNGEVHFTDYNGVTYCSVTKIYYPPITDISHTADPEYSDPPAWKAEWNASASAELVEAGVE